MQAAILAHMASALRLAAAQDAHPLPLLVLCQKALTLGDKAGWTDR